jgi:phosphoglycerate dehydrogenase-like enzyme
LGRIGSEVARWGRFVGMHVSGITRSPSPERAQALGLDALDGPDELDSYLAQADFVVVALPHTPETRGMIAEAQFRQMKSTAYLVNVARGPVIDEAALYHALRDKTIAGAAIDVWYNYPPVAGQHTMPSQYPIHELNNVIMTPHNSGMTNATMSYRWGVLAENMRRLTTGEPLENVVWPQSEKKENS